MSAHACVCAYVRACVRARVCDSVVSTYPEQFGAYVRVCTRACACVCFCVRVCTCACVCVIQWLPRAVWCVPACVRACVRVCVCDSVVSGHPERSDLLVMTQQGVIRELGGPPPRSRAGSKQQVNNKAASACTARLSPSPLNGRSASNRGWQIISCITVIIPDKSDDGVQNDTAPPPSLKCHRSLSRKCVTGLIRCWRLNII